MKKETQAHCSRKGCKGVMIKIAQSRMAESMGHRTYKCDKCGDKHKFTPGEG